MGIFVRTCHLTLFNSDSINHKPTHILPFYFPFFFFHLYCCHNSKTTQKREKRAQKTQKESSQILHFISHDVSKSCRGTKKIYILFVYMTNMLCIFYYVSVGYLMYEVLQLVNSIETQLFQLASFTR